MNLDDFGPVNDAEEMDRFRKALAPCRSCSHPKMAHSFLKSERGRCVDAKLNAAGQFKECSCKNFEPKDNLEFLEFKYDAKKKGE